VVAAPYTFTEHDLHALTDDELALGAEGYRLKKSATTWELSVA
jgi:hypothetical protein